MEKLISSLLYASNIFHIDENDLNLQLQSHTDYPSLKAVTDTLDYFGVDNIAANVPKDALQQMPNSFLALTNSGDEHAQNEMVLVSKKNGIIILENGYDKRKKVTESNFIDRWTGTIIGVEKEKDSQRHHFTKTISRGTIAALFILIATNALLIIAKTPMLWLGYSLTVQIGLIVSYLIVKESLGIKDQVSAKVCGAVSKRPDGCGAVINSNQGNFIKDFGLGDISISFFAFLFLTITFLGFNSSFLYVIAVTAIPVVLFSIYLQGAKLKQWCMLCLMISLVLLSQFVLLQTAFTSWDFSLHYIFSALLIGIVSFWGWYFTKQLWKDSIQLKVIKTEYYKFKRTKAFFLHSLQNNTFYDTSTLDPQTVISFGNPKAPIQIHAVTNPLCGFCKAPFEVYDKLLNTYPEDISLRLVFNVPFDSENKANQITSTFLELYQKDETAAFEALKAWFTDKNVEAWQAKYGVNPVLFTFSKKIIEAHKDWCLSSNIHHTPETIINGYSFPREEYKVDDLHFFIEDLKETQQLIQQELTT